MAACWCLVVPWVASSFSTKLVPMLTSMSTIQLVCNQTGIHLYGLLTQLVGSHVNHPPRLSSWLTTPPLAMPPISFSSAHDLGWLTLFHHRATGHALLHGTPCTAHQGVGRADANQPFSQPTNVKAMVPERDNARSLARNN